MSSSPNPNTELYEKEIGEIQNAETLEDLSAIAKSFSAQVSVQAGGALYGALQTKTETILETDGIAPKLAADQADGFVNRGSATVDPNDPLRPWAPIDPDFPRNPNAGSTYDPAKGESEGPEVGEEGGSGLETVGKGVEGALEIYDAAKSLKDYGELTSRSNQFAANDLLRTKALEIGGGFLAGEALDFAVGTGVSPELGPFAPLGGLAASTAGIFAGKEIADYLRKEMVNVNTGADGNSYEYKDGQWMTHNALLSIDAHVPVPAPAEQIPSLEMQRAAKLTSLAIADPPSLNENSIAATDPTTGVNATWERTGNSSWETRSGPACDVVAASPKLTTTLNTQSALIHTIGSDGADYAAKGYVSEFYGKGWNTIGTLPDSVTTQLHLPSENNIADPKTGKIWSVTGDFVYRDNSTLSADQLLGTALKPLQDAGLPTLKSYTDDLPTPAEKTRILAVRDAAVASNSAYGMNLIKQEVAALDAPPTATLPGGAPGDVALPGCAPVAPSAGVVVPHLPGAILPAAPQTSSMQVPDPQAQTAPTPASTTAPTPASTTAPTVTPTTAPTLAPTTGVTPTGLEPSGGAAPASYRSPAEQGGPIFIGDAIVAAVQAQVDRLRLQGTALPNVASVQPYTPQAQIGSFVHVTPDTVAQHMGRGQYQVASVSNDLNGVTPPEGRPVTVTPQGQVVALPAVSHVSSRMI